MKRLVFIALALILIINIVGCSVVDTGDGNETGDNAVSTGETSAEIQNGGDNTPENTTALGKKQAYISENGGLFGVSYLGFYEDRQEKVSDFVKKQKYYDAMAFLAEVSDDSTVSASGAELYVVVPASDISLTVYELSLDETTFEYKKSKAVFTSEKGEPFYLIGNVSDIIPTFIIAAEKEGKTVEYSPCLSLKDGKLSTPCEGVIDLTPYKYMGDFIYSMADESADYNVTVTKERAESILKQNSTIVMLNRNVHELATDGRPISMSCSLEKLEKERLPIYNKWKDFSVECTTPEVTANRIISEL